MDLDLLRFLHEDLAADGHDDAAALLVRDVTTQALSATRVGVQGAVVAREACVVAGLKEAAAVLAHLGSDVTPQVADGDEVRAGMRVLDVSGPAAGVLTGERVALNLLMRMSGIATLTRSLQRKVSAIHPGCRVAATRKTTPGFRRFEKRAVELGGGDPHRFGLHDAFLVKDNHLLVEPDVARVVARCRALDAAKFLQVEADTAEQARAAAKAGADGVLLDNFSPTDALATYRELKAGFPELLVEVSGGITPENIEAYAPAADRVSLGHLTHSVRAVDFGLDIASTFATKAY